MLKVMCKKKSTKQTTKIVWGQSGQVKLFETNEN